MEHDKTLFNNNLLTWELFCPLFGDGGVVDVVVQRSVGDRLDEVDTEVIPERPERVPALRVAAPHFGVALEIIE
jgi:hypothetical protein